jgi:hypothetical protein
MTLEQQQENINRFYNKLFYGQEHIPIEYKESINRTFKELSQLNEN